MKQTVVTVPIWVCVRACFGEKQGLFIQQQQQKLRICRIEQCLWITRMFERFDKQNQYATQICTTMSQTSGILSKI